MGQDQAEEGDLLPPAPDLDHRLAEVDLGMARRVMEAEGVPWVLRGARPDARLACLSWHWRRIRKETGLHDVRVHDLRHSYASRALALGEGLPAIGRLLGHVRVGTTAKYAHLVRDAEKAAAARTGDSIGAQILPRRAEAA